MVHLLLKWYLREKIKMKLLLYFSDQPNDFQNQVIEEIKSYILQLLKEDIKKL